MKTHIKKLGVFVVLFVIGLANALAEEITVTFLPNQTIGLTKSNNSPDTLKRDKVTITGSNAAFALQKQYKLYNSSEVTFSTEQGAIQKVVIQCDANHGPSFDSKSLKKGTYSCKDNVATWTGNAESFSIKTTNAVWPTRIEVTYDPDGSSELIPTTLTFEDPDNKFFAKSKKNQKFTNVATLSPAIEGAVITYSSDNTSLAIIDQTTNAVTVNTGNVGLATITAKYSGNDYYAPCKASYTIRVAPLTGDGSKDNPYTIADVITLGVDGVTGSDVYVKGVVNEVRSTAENIEDEKSCNYSVTDVVGDEQTLDVYEGKYLNQADIISAEQIATGDQVVLCGKLELVDEKSVRLAQGTYIDHFWGNELTVDEDRTSNTVENLRHATVTLHRTFNANAWNSLVLPFDITEERADQIFGSDACFANFTGTHLNSDDTYTLVFEMTESISANTPVFVYGASNAENIVIEDAQVVSETASVTPDNAAFTFMGSYDAMTLKAQDWFISSDNNFYRANGNETMKATRAVFRPLTSATGTSNLRFHLGERPTGIKVVGVGNIASRKVPECYNLMGQTVADNYHGIVIVNGKKYVNR